MIFTDRSRFITQFFCPFERFLAYHFLGRGITRIGHAIPLATGAYTHEAIQHILNIVQATGDLPSPADIREIVAKVNNDYITAVAKAGFLGLEENERVDHVVTEQTTLISGLVWAWAIYILPPFLEQYRILHVEQEMERIVGCKCGLSGIGTVKDHVKRNCNGIVIMTRPDIVTESYASNAIDYTEVKTGGKIESSTFDGDVQFAFGASGIEGFTGKELSGSWVHALSKGYRMKAYNPITQKKDGLPYQASSLCYAYVSGGISGMVPMDISFKYTKKKGYKKTPVWEIPFADLPEGIPPTEHYISLMSDEDLESNVKVFGQFPYPKTQVEELLLDIEHLERHNNEVYTHINSLIAAKGIEHEDVQAELHQHIPKSWYCNRYNKICNYRPICNKSEGWDDPLNNMRGSTGEPLYELRTPNHPIEFEDFSMEEK